MFTIERYLDLLHQFPPRPIKSETDFEAVQAVIDNLLDQDELTAEQQDYLDVLGSLVFEYETHHLDFPDLTGVELLKGLMAEFGLKQKDLVSIFKTESIVSEVCNGKRRLTLEHIEKLSAFFNISPAAFF